MMYRISGKLKDGRSFSNRADFASAIACATGAAKGLTDAGVKPEDVAELKVAPVGSSDGFYIGQGRKADRKSAKK